MIREWGSDSYLEYSGTLNETIEVTAGERNVLITKEKSLDDVGTILVDKSLEDKETNETDSKDNTKSILDFNYETGAGLNDTYKEYLLPILELQELTENPNLSEKSKDINSSNSHNVYLWPFFLISTGAMLLYVNKDFLMNLAISSA
ncbi:MAG: hypothetical protein Q9M91_08320 [Candidatus Dojkabacteria bacterium]|nr:hypothetical protein [Candidatus Dojkabacteria bacterium]MDQ7021779.1 hypothetical protein [Candidatus Dojkabacteria bacterium]